MTYETYAPFENGEGGEAVRQKINRGFDIVMKDQLRAQVEAATGGRCTVFYTAKGQPSLFHVLPKFKCEDIAPGGELGTGVHEAFIFDGVEASEIFIGMYQMSEVAGEGVSQPMKTPRTLLDWDASRGLIQACGSGFDMMTIWDWAAIVLWTSANGFVVRGNTNYGRHHNERHEVGRRADGRAPGEEFDLGLTLTGSGPNAWRHDNSPAGIADMVGNAEEWLAGMKTVDGRVWLAADNAVGTDDLWADSGWDYISTSSPWAAQNSSGAPLSLKRALIVPNGIHDPEGRNSVLAEGERFPSRGGNRVTSSNAGLASMRLSDSRNYVSGGVGSRPRYRPA